MIPIYCSYFVGKGKCSVYKNILMKIHANDINVEGCTMSQDHPIPSSCILRVQTEHDTAPLLLEPNILRVGHDWATERIKLNWSLSSYLQFSSVQSLSRVGLSATPWITACQASLSITITLTLTKFCSGMRHSNHIETKYL